MLEEMIGFMDVQTVFVIDNGILAWWSSPMPKNRRRPLSILYLPAASLALGSPALVTFASAGFIELCGVDSFPLTCMLWVLGSLMAVWYGAFRMGQIIGGKL